MKENNQMIVSIAIPVRNGEAYIHHTIENLLTCDYPADCYEILIGDHGSTDRTRDVIMEKWQDKPGVKLIPLEYESPNRAWVRNAIVKEARGELIIFLDGDILVGKNFIREHVNAHLLNPGCLAAGYVYGKMLISENESAKESTGRFNREHIEDSFSLFSDDDGFKDFRSSFLASEENITGFHSSTPWRFFWTTNVSIRLSDFHKIEGFDENFSGWGLEDDEFAYKSYLNNLKPVFVNSAWGFHFPHPTNAKKNISDWRQNLNYFFKKYASRAIELIHFTGFPERLSSEIAFNMQYKAEPDEYKKLLGSIGPDLPQRRGKRLGILNFDEDDARLLDLTHACIPGLDLNQPVYQKNGSYFYSLLGLKLPFENVSIDETVIFVDPLLFMNDLFLPAILLEVQRVSKSLILVYGADSNNNYFQKDVQRFESFLTMDSIHKISYSQNN